MTTAAHRGVGAALAREVRASPTTTVLAPVGLLLLGAWLTTATPASWLGLVVLFAGVGALVSGLGSAIIGATGYAGPAWWRRATGHDTGDRHSPGA